MKLALIDENWQNGGKFLNLSTCESNLIRSTYFTMIYSLNWMDTALKDLNYTVPSILTWPKLYMRKLSSDWIMHIVKCVRRLSIICHCRLSRNNERQYLWTLTCVYPYTRALPRICMSISVQVGHNSRTDLIVYPNGTLPWRTKKKNIQTVYKCTVIINSVVYNIHVSVNKQWYPVRSIHVDVYTCRYPF